ncbi:hypothetical protein [Amycolatopsis saalfeldensis]|uniref:Uncharacterized protein n=1 Tax=Amycolatopsis saalfeldensis TaxID=394193 RepID=A0A1H8YIJ9_9PSEU|nr:hypothetical protein [Amycolatopsis saalfeldensis]SEP51903.1 hypothetical protein SAMN04489732_117221 [Amycolatopsis saalfeldensis]
MGTSLKRTPRSALLTALLAALVTAGALVAVVVLRSSPVEDGAPGAAPVAAPGTDQPTATTCGTGPCRELAAMTVGGTPVSLLADATGGWGRVRVGAKPDTEFELAITGMGAKLAPNSLQCIAGTTSACLVRGDVSGGAFGELLIESSGVWRDFGQPYFADAGTLSLDDVDQDGRPDLILVRHECPGSTPGTTTCQAAPVLAEVYQLSGDILGCTRKVTSPSQLRGWPLVQVRRNELSACPAS